MDPQGQGQEQFLVGGAITIWKNMSSSMGRMIPYIMENKQMFETTNQLTAININGVDQGLQWVKLSETHLV